MDRVKGKVAIVTGAANGIGEATAKLMAREGAKVAIVDIDDKNGIRVQNEIKAEGGVADFWHMDVTKSAEVEKVIGEVYQKYGQLHILVNNAGVGGGRSAPHKTPEAELDRVMNINMKGPFFCTKYSSLISASPAAAASSMYARFMGLSAEIPRLMMLPRARCARCLNQTQSACATTKSASTRCIPGTSGRQCSRLSKRTWAAFRKTRKR